MAGAGLFGTEMSSCRLVQAYVALERALTGLCRTEMSCDRLVQAYLMYVPIDTRFKVLKVLKVLLFLLFMLKDLKDLLFMLN